MRLSKALWLAACAVGIWATPYAFQAATAARGYQAIGGEIFVPLLAPGAWWAWEGVKATVKYIWEELK